MLLAFAAIVLVVVEAFVLVTRCCRQNFCCPVNNADLVHELALLAPR